MLVFLVSTEFEGIAVISVGDLTALTCVFL